MALSTDSPSFEVSGVSERELAETEAWSALSQLFFEGVGAVRFHQACSATGLAPGVVKALLQLELDHQLPMRDLASAMHCDPSYVTGLVDSLEEAGLAERRTHPSDRRIKAIALTSRGAEVQGDVHKIMAQPPQQFAALSIDELHQLGTLLRKLARGAGAEGPTTRVRQGR